MRIERKCSFEFCQQPNFYREDINQEYDQCIIHLPRNAGPKPGYPGSKKSVRQEILQEAINLTCGDRNKTYGPPRNNLYTFSQLVTAYIDGIPGDSFEVLDATDGAIIMALAKISRIAVNKQHKDNYIDGAAYLAIAGECANDI